MWIVRLRLVCALLVALAVPAYAVRAQEEGTDALRLVSTTSEAPAEAAPAAAPAALPAAGAPAVYLPLLASAPTVRLEFSSSATDTCNPFVPATNYGYGIKYLCYRITITGGKGLTYRTEWSIDGKAQTGLNESSTVFSSPEIERGVICYGAYGLSCGSALPRGTWLVKVYLNEQLYQQVTVKIA